MQVRSGAVGAARRRWIGAWLAVSLLASVLAVTSLMASSSAQVTQPTDGTVVRDAGPLTINEDRGGRYLGSSSTRANAGAHPNGCNGTGGKAQPKSTITVTRVSDDTVVHTATKITANKGVSFLGIIFGDAAGANAAAPWSTSWDTTGATPGLYKIRSVNTDVTNSSSTSGSTSVASCAATAGPATTDVTIEYRPWQIQKFNDFFGGGNVRMNITPTEFQYSVSGQSSAILPGGGAVTFYSSPEGLLSLGGGGDCTVDPVSCLPVVATGCDPGAGCVPRLVVINHQTANEQLIGVFDLDTGAFVASAVVAGHRRILSSAGTQIDGLLHDQIDGLADAAAAQGIDLISLLNQKGQIMLGGQTYEISLVEGLQIIAALPEGVFGDGLRVVNEQGVLVDTTKLGPDISVAAGFVSHTVSFDIVNCLLSGQETASERVYTSTLAPELPASLPLLTLLASGLASSAAPLPPEVAAILGPTVVAGSGPLTALRLDYGDGVGSHDAGHGKVPLLGLSSGPNVAVDTPSGALVVPGVTPDMVIPDQSPMNFLGYVTASINLGCLGHGFAGTGLATFGDFPVDAGALPLLWDIDNPAIADLNAQILAAADQTVGQAVGLLGDPNVATVVAAALSLLGSGTGSLDEVTAVLGGEGSFSDLLLVVLEDGPGAIDGLTETLADLGVALPEVPGTGSLTGVLDPVLGLLGL